MATIVNSYVCKRCGKRILVKRKRFARGYGARYKASKCDCYKPAN